MSNMLHKMKEKTIHLENQGEAALAGWWVDLGGEHYKSLLNISKGQRVLGGWKNAVDDSN